MNCCLWIILLLACRGNSGFGWGNTWSGSGCNCNRMDGCDGDMMCNRRNADRDDDNDCDMCRDRDERMRERSNNDDCDMCRDRDERIRERSNNDDCDCMRNENRGRMQSEEYSRNENRDRTQNEERSRNENRMTYETFGCQENGVPCPPPVPGNYMR